ncbi:winged helix-turn-helix domain-containing protein [Breoghania sp. L-A4]|uniref:ArsR/SmtB family transcription factor n=1 Tax=Breoghania sp. L-A4 TaxID=2304600 RepID=UPI000E35CEE5|nr:winged helix-turn-helix domain-containing protein [Breoghania sp. L-A4]AXS39915.1 ArsR family transcriptional regulator [Breoghania sp. L-A4]
MKTGPDIARIASLIGDPARANILTALMGGQALTASELALEAGVSLPTASSHLSKLLDGDLVRVTKQGRHRYFRLANPDVAHVLETIMGLAARAGHARVRTGPREPAMRKARMCYDHLAGDMGVRILESLLQRGFVGGGESDLVLTAPGARFCEELGIGTDGLAVERRPMCRACLDWSVRRHHLAGGLGAALARKVFDLGWASRVEGGRAVIFTAMGEAAFQAHFPLDVPLAVTHARDGLPA